MCEPVSLLTFAVSAASTAFGTMSQMSAAEQQASEQDRLYRQNRANAIASFEDNNRSLSLRQIQEQDAASAQRFDTNLEARSAKATAITAAGETGVTGLSIEGLLGEFSGRAARANDRQDQQTDWTMAQIQQEKKGAGYQMVDRINSVQQGQHPNKGAMFADAGLRILGAGVSAYSQAKTNIKNGAQKLW